MQPRNRHDFFGQLLVAFARPRHRPDTHSERAHSFRHGAPDCAEADEKKSLPVQLARAHRGIPQFLLTPPRLLLQMEAVRESARHRNQHAENVLGHRDGVDAARVGHFDAALAKFRVHQLAHARGRRMQPFQLAREPELFGTERETDEYVHVGEFGIKAIVIGQVLDAHFGPALADTRSHFRWRVPQREAVPDTNDQLRFYRLRAIHREMTRKSWPVISSGSGMLATPSNVGAMSRSEPPVFNWARPSSLTRMNG